MCNGKTKTLVLDCEGKELYNSMENSRVVDFGEKMNEMLDKYCNHKQIKSEESNKSKGEDDEFQIEEGVDKKRKK